MKKKEMLAGWQMIEKYGISATKLLEDFNSGKRKAYELDQQKIPQEPPPEGSPQDPSRLFRTIEIDGEKVVRPKIFQIIPQEQLPEGSPQDPDQTFRIIEIDGKRFVDSKTFNKTNSSNITLMLDSLKKDNPYLPPGTKTETYAMKRPAAEEDMRKWLFYDEPDQAEKEKAIAKQDIPSADIQNETAEQDHDVFIEKKVFPCNPGARWDQIEMALLPAGEKFSVKTPLGRGYYDHIELGLFNDRKNSKEPNILWGFLKEIAKRKGFFSLKGVGNFEELSSNAKRLNKHLKQLFGLHESIYKGRCDRIGGYETKFRISQISDNDKVDRRSLIDEELEDPKYSNIKKSSYYPEHSTFKKE